MCITSILCFPYHIKLQQIPTVQSFCQCSFYHFPTQTMGNLFHNYSKICWGILIGLAASLMLSILWLNLLRLSTSFTVWITIIVIFVLQGFGNFFFLVGFQLLYQLIDFSFNLAFWICFTRFTELKDLHSQSNYQTLEKVSSIMNLGSYLELTQTWVAFLIILGSSMVIILLSLILFRNRIPSAIALISHASKYVEEIFVRI